MMLGIGDDSAILIIIRVAHDPEFSYIKILI